MKNRENTISPHVIRRKWGHFATVRARRFSDASQKREGIRFYEASLNGNVQKREGIRFYEASLNGNATAPDLTNQSVPIYSRSLVVRLLVIPTPQVAIAWLCGRWRNLRVVFGRAVMCLPLSAPNQTCERRG